MKDSVLSVPSSSAGKIDKCQQSTSLPSSGSGFGGAGLMSNLKEGNSMKGDLVQDQNRGEVKPVMVEFLVIEALRDRWKRLN